MNTNKEKIASILRGEVSAFEAYDRVLKKMDNFPNHSVLKDIRSTHKAAADFWKTEATFKNVDQKKDSGAWGTVVQTLLSTTKVLGNEATLMTIKKGEEHGLELYQDMLKDESIAPRIKAKIETHFIPNQRKHISSLENLMP